jgi:pimeloyl-ACP methyl ester carboxylesterase
VSTTASGRTLSADGTEIGWQRMGAGQPLVMIHGSMSDHTCWSAVAPLLSASFDLVMIDRRGRGLSPARGGRHDLGSEVADLRAVVAAVGQPAAICAWSYGAVVALEAVLDGLPCTGLVLYEPPVPVQTAGPPPGFRQEFARLAEAGEYETAAVLFLTSVMGLPPPVVEVMRRFPLWSVAVAGVPSTRWEAAVLDDYRYDAARVRSCSVPTTVLAGTASPVHLVEASERLAGDLAAAHLVRLDGQHHFAHLSDPGRFAAAVAAALATGNGGGAGAS